MDVVVAEVDVVRVNCLIPSARHWHSPGTTWARESVGVVDDDGGRRPSIRNQCNLDRFYWVLLLTAERWFHSAVDAPLFKYAAQIGAATMKSVVPPIKACENQIFCCSSRYQFSGFLHFQILNIFIHFS
jgi:hypothetical protein